jgi:hypothetical protein
MVGTKEILHEGFVSPLSVNRGLLGRGIRKEIPLDLRN